MARGLDLLLSSSIANGRVGAFCGGMVMREDEDHLEKLVMALRHPLRRELLRLVKERTEISVRQGARSLSQPLGTVRYHLNVLEEAKALELGSPQLVKGSWTKLWRITKVLDQTAWVHDALGLRKDSSG
jgi:DNA-binding transcriptional ArsR family regulator